MDDSQFEIKHENDKIRRVSSKQDNIGQGYLFVDSNQVNLNKNIE